MNGTLLDRIFSEYIRIRDIKYLNGYCECISCGKLLHWKEMDCGHYINRKHMSLRFNEINCNAQCRSCNRFDEGNMEGYRRGLIKKHGSDMIDKLYASKNNVLKLSKFEISVMIKDYRNKVKELKQSKGII